MQSLFNKTVKAENTFYKDKSLKVVIMMIKRYFILYYFNLDIKVLNRAYHTAVTMFNINKGSIILKLFIIFLEIQLENYDRAYGELASIDKYKNYYKNNEPSKYVYFIYLSALLSIHADKERIAKKNLKILKEYVKDRERPMFILCIASLEMAFGNYTEGYTLINNAYINGSNSPFLYMCIYEYFNKSLTKRDKFNLILPLMDWAISNRINIEGIIERQKEILLPIFLNNPKKAKETYQLTNSSWILKEIVGGLINAKDYSKDAFKYYRDAELRQMNINNLEKFLIKSAAKNNMEQVSRYSLEKFLNVNEMDSETKAFVYHLILIHKNFQDFEERVRSDIIDFCFSCLNNNCEGRYYNTLYSFFLNLIEEIQPENAYITKCEEFLKKDLFYFEALIQDPDIRFVWVFEQEKTTMSVYEVHGEILRIKASSDKFSYICLGEAEKEIIDKKLKITKLIENANDNLYLYFFNKGIETNDLIINLAKHYLDTDLDEDCIDILNNALFLRGISANFRMQIAATLGNMLAAQNRYDKALAYYNGVDENYLSDNYIEQMLTAFINAKEFDKAINLINKKAHCISDRTLFYALKRLITIEKYRACLADVAYELILKSWYDKSLIHIVLKFYKGSQENWQELSRVLLNISSPILEVEEIILKNSIWLHKFDLNSEKVFKRIYESMPEIEIIETFVSYITFEVIINNITPQFETIEIMENIFLKNKDHLLSYALAHIYLLNSINTINSEEILNRALINMEEDKIILPIIKEQKDKKMKQPYILKNQPFVYRALPNKEIYLNYRDEDSQEFYQEKMKYLKFGLYITAIPHFYSEKLIYYFTEQSDTGNVSTKEETIINTKLNIMEEPIPADDFFVINNAIIYEQMFKYEQVEKIVTDMLSEGRTVKAELLN